MKGKKICVVTMGMVAMLVAVAMSTVTKSNASRLETNVKTVESVETGTNPSVEETVSPVVDQSTCTHANIKEIVTKVPTCKKNGMTEYRCLDCDKLMSKEVTSKIGHSYDENEKCSNCGEYKTPSFLGKYEVDNATYQVSLPFSNGWGNVTYIAPVDKSVTNVNIPKEVTINGVDYQVTKIADNAFDGCNKLKKVTIGKEVKTIGKYAFADCSNLKSVSMGNGVEKIEKGAFSNCKSLTSIDISKNVEEIGDEAFSNCIKLKSAKIGKNVIKISKKAFYNCIKLKKVEIGKAVKKIENKAFCNCVKLEKIEIESTVLSSIGKEAFYGIASDAVITIDKETYDTISVLFTAEVGFENSMTIQAKKSLLDYFGSNDEQQENEVTDELSTTDEVVEEAETTDEVVE